MSDPRSNLVAPFLGSDVDPDDPRSLLGLPCSGVVSKDTVLAALRERIKAISSHPDGNTLHADEVRLLLHAAAARLIEHTFSATEPDADPQLETRLAVILARHGGWSREAARELAIYAHERGISAERLVAAIDQIIHRPSPSSHTVGRQPAGDKLLERTMGMDQGERAVRTLVITVPGVILALVLGSLALITLLRSVPQPNAQPRVSSQEALTPPAQRPGEIFPVPPKRVETPPPRIVDPSSPGRVGDMVDLLRELSAAASELDGDPEGSLVRAEKAVASLAREWTSAPSDQVVAATSSVLEFLYRVSADPERAVRVLDVLERLSMPLARTEAIAPEEVAPAAFGAGLLARLLRERDLPVAVRGRIRELFVVVFGPQAAPGEASFRSGALAALAAMPRRLLLPPAPYDDADAKRAAGGWNAWVDALTVLDGEDGPTRERLILAALEDLLTQAPEPTASRPVYDAITLLVPSLRWRKGGQARAALLRWFGMPEVSHADLHAVTSALATRSAAEGVDLSMVLSPAGAEAHRTELRDRYAAIWGLSVGPSRSDLIEEWLTRARKALDATPQSSDPHADLAQAVNLARLTQAGALLWAGSIESVPLLLSAEPFVMPSPRDDFGGTSAPLGVADPALAAASWTARYLAAGQAIPPRREILAQINAPPAPLEADILVEEAVRGTPVQVRQDARNIVIRYATTATIINAFLELAPTMPATRENTELIRIVTGTDIPDPRGPAWRVEVRKALVERLIEALADQGPLAAIDRAADDLARSYAPRPTPASGDDPQATSVVPPPVELSARAFRARLRVEAQSLLPTGREPIGLREIDTRYGARLRLASGRVHLFAAEVFSAVELLAYIVAAERPGDAPSIATILREFDSLRQSSGHVFSQLRYAERAMLQLWVRRFGGEGR
jgi:hypothetical protein